MKPTVTISVDRNGRTYYSDPIDKKEMIEAMAWLRDNNGHAPTPVQSLIKAMEIAVGLAT